MKSKLKTRRKSIAVPVLSGVIAVMLAAIVIISFAYFRQMRLNQFTKNILFSDNYFMRNYTYEEDGDRIREGFTRSEGAYIVSLMGMGGARTDSFPENASASDVKALYYNCAAQKLSDTAGKTAFSVMYGKDMGLRAEGYSYQELCDEILLLLSALETDLFYAYSDPFGEIADVFSGGEEIPQADEEEEYYVGEREYSPIFNFNALITEGVKTLAAKETYTADDVSAVYYYCVGEILSDAGKFFGIDVMRSSEADSVIAENSDGIVRILDVEYISQLPKYPNGCEAVSAVMLLRNCGFDISEDVFISDFLTKEPVKISWGVRFGPDPEKAYAGDPASERGGWGCFAPVIESSLNAYLAESGYHAQNLSGISLDRLCENYIDRGIPAAVWITTDFSPVNEVYQWLSRDRKEVYLYPKNQHCAVLIGYDRDNYYFCDPLSEDPIITAPRAKVSESYTSMGSQAVVVEER